MKNLIKTKSLFKQFVDGLRSEKDDGIIDLYLAENNIEMVKQDSLNQYYIDFLNDKLPLSIDQVSSTLFITQKLGNVDSIANYLRKLYGKQLGDYAKLPDEKLTKNIVIFYLFSRLHLLQKKEIDNNHLDLILHCLPCNYVVQLPINFRFYALESILVDILLKFEEDNFELFTKNNDKLMVQKTYSKAKNIVIQSDDYDNHQKLKITLLSIESNLIHKEDYVGFIQKELGELSFINPADLSGLLSFLQAENKLNKIAQIDNFYERQKLVHLFMENLKNTISAYLNHGKIELPSSDIHLSL